MKKILILGMGYVGQFLASKLKTLNFSITGTTRDLIKAKTLERWGYEMFLFDDLIRTPEKLFAYDSILDSIPPSENNFKEHLAHHPSLKWFGYLSSTSVYGDHQGDWVTEESKTLATSIEGKKRLEAENFYLRTIPQTHIFRLSGIYGPKRNTLQTLHAGKARRIFKEGHYISRIHVDDIVDLLIKSMDAPTPQNIYNLADMEPSSSFDVVTYGAELLKIDPPMREEFSENIPLPLKRFYDENKRVSAQKILNSFQHILKYPTYKEGLKDLYLKEFS